MRKTLKERNLHERPTMRALVALTLSASLAAFGCTTNRNPGNGEPVMTPGVGPTTPSSSATPGTSSGNNSNGNLPAPMTSSYQRNDDALPRVTARSRADAAAAVMAQHQPVQGRVLGTVNPGSSGRGYVSDMVVTGAFRNPAMLTNPQSTINSSISSGPNMAVSGGVGGGTAVVNGAVVAASVNGTSGLSTSVNDVGNATVLGNVNSTGAPLFPATAHPVTPTNAALPLSPGAFAAGTAGSAVAQSSGATLGVVNALATPIGTPSPGTQVSVADGGTTTVAASTNTTTGNTTVSGNARVARASNVRTLNATTSTNGNVRTVRSNGRVVITNQ